MKHITAALIASMVLACTTPAWALFVKTGETVVPAPAEPLGLS